MNKQLFFKKDGSSEWMEYGPIRNLNGFNRDFADWIGRYYEDGKKQCQRLERRA